MVKFGYEKRLEAVKAVIEKGLSQRAAGKLIGANQIDVQNWVRLYREHGEKGLQIKGGRSCYDGNFKVKVVEYMYVNHLSIREASAKFAIPDPITVRNWKHIYDEEGRDALFEGKKKKPNNKPIEPKLDIKTHGDLIAEVGRLKMENAYLKKLNALVQKRIQQENGKK